MNKTSSIVQDIKNKEGMFSDPYENNTDQFEQAQVQCCGDLIIEENTIYEIDRDCIECMEHNKKK